MSKPINLTSAEFNTVVWYHTAPAGTDLKEMLEPAYWQHVTKQLRPGHEIKVTTEDRAIWAHLMVRDVRKLEANVAVIVEVSFKGEKIEATEDVAFEVKWRSPSSRFGVFRKEDGECMQDGFETKESGFEWIAERAKSMAA